MEEIYVLKIFNLVVGIVGFAVGFGVILAPKIISAIEKNLDKDFSTESLEKMLNQRRNITEALMRHPKIFGAILVMVSFFLLASSILIF